jgi:hypothetical protein
MCTTNRIVWRPTCLRLLTVLSLCTCPCPIAPADLATACLVYLIPAAVQACLYLKHAGQLPGESCSRYSQNPVFLFLRALKIEQKVLEYLLYSPTK